LKQSIEFYKNCRDRSLFPNDIAALEDTIVCQWKEFDCYTRKTDLLIGQLMKKIKSVEQEITVVLRRNRFDQRSKKIKMSSSSSSLKKHATSSKACANQFKDVATEQPGLVPSQVTVKQHVRKRYVC